MSLSLSCSVHAATLWQEKPTFSFCRSSSGIFSSGRYSPNSRIAGLAGYFICRRRRYPSRQEIGRQWTPLVTYCSSGCKILRIHFPDGIDSVSLRIRANQRCRLVRCQLNGALLSLSGNARYGAMCIHCLECRACISWYLTPSQPGRSSHQALLILATVTVWVRSPHLRYLYPISTDVYTRVRPKCRTVIWLWIVILSYALNWDALISFPLFACLFPFLFLLLFYFLFFPNWNYTCIQPGTN